MIRELVLGMVAALAFYLLWLCFRLFSARNGRSKKSLSFSESDDHSETLHSQILGGEDAPAFSSAHFDSRVEAYSVPLLSERTEPKLNRVSEPDAGAFGFDALMEVRQARHLFDELRVSHQVLEQKVALLIDEMQALRAACQVSPMYSDAVALARRGYDAQAIAERCGISIAEAQLVCSLSADAKETSSDD